MTSRSFASRLLPVALAAFAAFLLGRLTAPRTTAPRSDAATAASPAREAPRVVAAPATTAPVGDGAAATADLARRVARPPACLADEEERQRLLEAWAEHDPAGALAFARENLRSDRRAQAVAAILAAWGRRDPDAAWRWVEQHEPDARHHFDTLLESLGRVSPERAARYAADYAARHPGTTAEMHLAALLGVTHAGDFAAARALIAANPRLTDEERGVLQNFLAGQWARFAPAAAAEWVAGLPAGPARDQATIGLTESWSETNPAGAAAFAVGLPPGELRQLALRQAILKWSLDDPARAHDWVAAAAPHVDFDQAIASMVTLPGYLERNLDLALRWTDTIYDAATRDLVLTQIIGNWHAHDAPAALQFLATTPKLSAERRAELRRQLQPGS